MNGMSILLRVALAVLALAVVLATARLLRGPSALDRLVALDAVVALVLCVLMVIAALTGDSSVIPVIVATSLVGFLGSSTVARLLGRDRGAGAEEDP